MDGFTLRRGPREQSDPERHRPHAADLAASDTFVQEASADRQEHHEAHRERRLYERQRDQQKSSNLRGPAEQREQRPDEPARLRDEAAEE